MLEQGLRAEHVSDLDMVLQSNKRRQKIEVIILPTSSMMVKAGVCCTRLWARRLSIIAPN